VCLSLWLYLYTAARHVVMQCEATTAAGNGCKNNPTAGKATCHVHSTRPRAEQDGRIYVLSNKRVEGIKVGWTAGRASDRASALTSTAVPTPFKVEYESGVVPNALECEQMVFERLAGCRVAPNREFFDTNPGHVQRVVESVLADRNNKPLCVYDVAEGVQEVTLRFANMASITVRVAGSGAP